MLQFASKELLCPKKSYLLEVLVAVNVFLVVGVLQLVCFDVLPESLDDGRACLRVDSQQTGQPRVQLKLGRLEQKAKEVAIQRKADRYTSMKFQFKFLGYSVPQEAHPIQWQRLQKYKFVFLCPTTGALEEGPCTCAVHTDYL